METYALIDSGSMITTISEDFFNSLRPLPELQLLSKLDNFTVEGAGGHDLPYSGYIECTIEVPFLANQSFEVPVLVVPTTQYSLKVPVVVGTNVIRQCNERSKGHTNIPREWTNAFVSFQQTRVGVVKSTNHQDIQVQPFETVTLSGFVRKDKNVETVVTEQTQGASTRIGVCPRVVSLDKVSKSERVPVRIFNMSAKILNIKPRSDICELHEVKILRSIEPAKSEKKQATVNQQTVNQAKSNKVIEEINIGDCKISPQEKDRLQMFLTKWNDIFSKGLTDLGNCDLVKHEIKLNDDIPIKEPARRIPPALFQEVREHLKEMMEAGAIKASQSPYSSNAVIVRKKDGTIRFCVDFRKLNNKTIKDAYAIPRVEESLHLLAGSKYFSKLDLRSGYWQVEIREEDKPKTAFQVGSLGFYEFNRMPFGLCNAPATFQRLMERCMGDLNLRDCLIYLDDIIIFSSTFEEHLEHLEAVFARLKEHNLKLKASKCEFLKSEVKYLGHVVSEEGVKTDPEKLDALRSWPVPGNVKDVRTFLGFTGYYRRFIKNYASIARPLNDLLIGHCTNQKGKQKKKLKPSVFIWAEPQQKAFEQLIEKLTNPPVLAYADYQLPFKLHIDACCTGLGAVLYQTQAGTDRVVAYASRSLKPSEKNYPAHKLEFLALKWAITEKFHDYLYGANFEVVTDNNPLTYVFTTAKLDATGQRWLAELSNYNCTISYRSGKQNADADGLSRQHESETVNTLFPEILKTVYQSSMTASEHLPSVQTLSNVEGVDLSGHDEASDIPEQILEGTALKSQDWIKAQAADPNINFVLDCLVQGRKPEPKNIASDKIDRRYLSDWQNYHLKDGVLYKKFASEETTIDRLCLPASLRTDILKAYHDDLGHQGRERTMSLVKRRFIWPGMDKDITDFIHKCGRCIRRKTAHTKSADLVNIVTKAPMELVCIDYLSLERSKGGYENILVITDHFTRYAQAIPTRNQTAATTARVLFDNFFVHYGFPGKLHSDQGANFLSKVIKKLCSLTGTVKTRTTPYHPMGNGMCERFNKTLLNMLGTLQEKQKSDWKSYVPTLTHAYNAATHKSTGYAPFYLMYGRHPRLAVDAFLGIGDDALKARCHPDYVDKLQDRLAFAYDAASKEGAANAKKHKDHYDLKVRHSVLQPGDRVLVRNVGLKGKQKLADIWEKNTYIVKRQIAPDIPVYEVRQEGSTKRSRTLHRNMLLPFDGLPVSEDPTTHIRDKPRPVQLKSSSEESDWSTSDSSSSDESYQETRPQVKQNPQPPYVIPQRRGKETTGSIGDMENGKPVEIKRGPRLRRGSRNRRPPDRFQAGERRVPQQMHVFTVNPEDVIYI